MKIDHASALPLVSAVVPAYNAERYLGQTLQSLITQSYENLEIVVVDDGSQDETWQVAQTMAQKYSQIRVVQQTNQGVAAARNRGIEEARGEFIAPIDADDIWFPDAVLQLTNCLRNSDTCTGVAYGWSVTLGEDGLLDGGLRCSQIAGNVLGTLICHNFLGSASATLIRRTCFEKVGGYDLRFRTESAQGCEDWDLYLRIAQYYRFVVVPQFLFGYRKSRHGMSSNAKAMAKSHGHLLEKVKLQYPRTPQVFYQFSTSSYYLYLAYECDSNNHPFESFYWLRRAVVNGPVFTLIRLGFYWLVVKNLFTRLCLSVRRCLGLSAQKTSAPGKLRAVDKPILQVVDIERKQLRILFKLVAQHALHRVVAWLMVWQQADEKGARSEKP